MKPAVTISLPPRISRRSALTGLFALGASAMLTGCGAAAVTTAQATPASSQQANGSVAYDAIVTVSETSIGRIAQDFKGLAYEKSNLWQPVFSPENKDLIALFQLLGPGVLRIGGNSVDEASWSPDGVGGTANQIAPSDVAALGAFLAATGWSCIYGLNLGGSAYGKTSPTLAGDEAAFAAQQLGSALIGFELGNECENYGDPGSYYTGNWSLNSFLALWNQFASVILDRVPEAFLVGPATGVGQIESWTVPFSKAIPQGRLRSVTQHYYRGDGHLASSTASKLLDVDATLVQNLGALQSASLEIKLPFRMAECNTYYNGGVTGVSNAYVSALWALDFLFTCAANGASGVNLQGGGDWTGYTPIADKAGTVIEARPEFYGLLLFALAGTGTLCKVDVACGTRNASAYALRRSDGSHSIVILNKDSSSLDTRVSLPHQAAAASVLQLSQLTAGASAPSLSATSGVTIGNASVGKDGSFNPEPATTLEVTQAGFSYSVPALSAVLIRVEPSV